jgi:pyruvate dehydrogenase E1 component alpha subunit
VESESTFLAGSYRPDAEVESWRERDPIVQLAARLKILGLKQSALDKLQVDVAAQADEAFEFARNSPMPEAAAALRDVFTETPDS